MDVQAATAQAQVHPAVAGGNTGAAPAAKAKRPPTVYTKVNMQDFVTNEAGQKVPRVVEFAGKKKMMKTILYSKDLETWHEDIEEGDQHVKVRFDFVNGETREFSPPDSLLLTFLGHGASQKIGDETANETEDVDDMVVAVDNIIEKLNAGNWSSREPGESFGGAAIVIKALMEASGKTLGDIKTYLQGKLDQAKAKGETLTRAQLYASFRNPASKVGKIVRRMEEEKTAKNIKIDADAELAAGLQVTQ